MRTAAAVWLVAGGLALAGCTNGEPNPPGETSRAPSGPWEMPNLVGSTLQAAQDKIQKLTGNPLFLTLSHDATGQKRFQARDANWKVCTQNVAPGTPFTRNTTIDFGAVKQDENCP